MLRSKQVLYLLIPINPTLLSIHKQYFSWLEAAFLHDIRRIEIQHADFRSHDHRVIFSDRITSRAQPITVQHSASISSIAE